MKLTWASPHLGQVAISLPGLLTKLHHIPAQRFWGNGHLSEMLVVVAKVHGEEHLGNTTKQVEIFLNQVSGGRKN